jgi:hypothetical protein
MDAIEVQKELVHRNPNLPKLSANPVKTERGAAGSVDSDGL